MTSPMMETLRERGGSQEGRSSKPGLSKPSSRSARPSGVSGNALARPPAREPNAASSKLPNSTSAPSANKSSTAAMNELGLDVQGAVDYIGVMIRQRIDQYVTEKHCLPS
ncbi:hypothetical protein FRC04_010070 [Tulasnella sp. 424]|nr:hypothetical protein FRC04_010070 [Tulasnella sp. 424]KAG8974093.1 hypothetical protein FRC05_007841 [Tulasnella sp. 425]